MTRLSIRLLGPLQVTLDGQPVTGFRSDKVRALLAYLVVEAEGPHRREKLAGLLWPDWPEDSARANLRRALADLRQAIGDRQATPPFLHISRQTIQFNDASDAWVDVTAFTHLLRAGGSLQETTHQLKKAVELYRGSFLEGFSLADSPAFEEWMLLTRERLQRLVVEALRRLTDCYEQQGEYEQALQHAWRQVELDPWRENAHRQLMRLLALSGQRGAALAQYETCRQLLAEELGVAPSEQTRELYQRLLQEEWPPTVAIPEREPRPVRECPYRGLSVFREADAPFFFGREDFVARLAVAVRRRPAVVVIVGSSGSGKSSVVFAGLLPHLRDADTGDWLFAEFRPGARPFHAQAAALLPLLEPQLSETDQLIETRKLAEGLSAGGLSLYQVVERILEKSQASRLLLVVDQFEELYTLCPEPDIRRRFLDGLLAAAESGRRIHPLVLLLTLRADFMGQALAYRPFADALQDASLILGPMTRDELRSAIEKPAEKQGAAFEAGLVQVIAVDVFLNFPQIISAEALYGMAVNACCRICFTAIIMAASAVIINQLGSHGVMMACGTTIFPQHIDMHSMIKHNRIIVLCQCFQIDCIWSFSKTILQRQECHKHNHHSSTKFLQFPGHCHFSFQNCLFTTHRSSYDCHCFHPN